MERKINEKGATEKGFIVRIRSPGLEGWAGFA